jgi:hypothetical protein
MNDPTSQGKFRLKWEGPFRVVRKTSSVNFEIVDINEEARLKNKAPKFIVHINRLKKISFDPVESNPIETQMQKIEEQKPTPMLENRKRGRPPKRDQSIESQKRRLPGKRRGRPPKALSTPPNNRFHVNFEPQTSQVAQPIYNPYEQQKVKPIYYPTYPNNPPRYNLRKTIKTINRY